MEQRYLGIDYGEQRVGLALSYGTLAEPLDILINDETLFTELERICKREGVTTLVVGMSENETAARTQEFARQAQDILTLPVVFEDETLSSQEVERRLHETHAGKQKPRGPYDHYAATIILQNFLDFHEA